MKIGIRSQRERDIGVKVRNDIADLLDKLTGSYLDPNIDEIILHQMLNFVVLKLASKNIDHDQVVSEFRRGLQKAQEFLANG